MTVPMTFVDFLFFSFFVVGGGGSIAMQDDRRRQTYKSLGKEKEV